MEIINIDNNSPTVFPEGCVLTQGTFDGIHLGHVELLRSVKELADEFKAPPVLLTFKPHPAKVLRPSRRMRLLTVEEEKIDILEKIGLDYLAFISFNTKLAILEAEDYIRDILVGKMAAKAVVVGYNHTFGRKRQGNSRILEKLKTRYGYKLTIVPPVLYKDEPVHSSRIRKDLIEGRFESAVTMLNRPYRISGVIVKGQGVGRQLGYPTINVRADDDKLIPKSGVYAAKVKINSNWRLGMMYISDDRTIFDAEISIFDFVGDLYDRYVTVDIFERTRDSMRFDSRDKLIAQIASDEKRIRKILSSK